MLASEQNRQKLQMMMRTFFNRLHGYHVQFNVVDRATLLDAQAHPEAHKDLIVRVAGYNAFFNVLSKTTEGRIRAHNRKARKWFFGLSELKTVLRTRFSMRRVPYFSSSRSSSRVTTPYLRASSRASVLFLEPSLS